VHPGRIIAGTMAAIAAGALTYAANTRGSTDLDMELTASRSPNERYTFTITGTPIDGLYPGAVRTIRLTFTNPYGYDLNVTAMRVELVAASKPGCQPIATNLEIGPYSGRLPVVVPAEDSKATGNVPLRMPNTVANDCQQAVFTIKLSGDAVRAHA
jgi:hypothetical protein